MKFTRVRDGEEQKTSQSETRCCSGCGGSMGGKAPQRKYCSLQCYMTNANPMRRKDVAKRNGETRKAMHTREEFIPHFCTEEGRRFVKKFSKARMSGSENPMKD